MKDDMDFEDGLKKFRHDPKPRVKKSVMSAFRREFGSADAQGSPVRFWRRPVPLYVAAAFVVVMMGLSYFAGKRSLVSGGPPIAPEHLIQGNDVTPEGEITWTVAKRDLL